MRERVSGDATPGFVVEKTPAGARRDGLDLERKRDCYPDAWYLHIVRDREAVIRSLMRAPFMEDRSREGCAAHRDRVVENIRRCFGDLPRYREFAYEDLRRDPAQGCREIFEWVGLAADDDTLDVVRALSRERFSERGAGAPAAANGSPDAWSVRARRALARVRRAGPAVDEPPARERVVTFLFTQALHQRDPAALRSLTHTSLEFVHRSPEGDVWMEGDEAHEALERLARDTFTRGYVGEWWASASGGPGEWWSSAPGRPFCTVFFSGLGGDATRVDLAVGLMLEDDLVRRAVLVSAGPLTGRPIQSQSP